MPHTSLTVEMGSRSRPFDLHTEVIRVGHADHCELVLPFDWVHPEHFTLQWRAGAAFARASAGQTLLNSRPLTADWSPLNVGDELRIPSPAGKPISILITQLGSTAPIPQPIAPQPAPLQAAALAPAVSAPANTSPHLADSHMAAIAAVTVGVLLVGIGLAIYLALATTARPTRLTAAPTTTQPTTEISNLQSPIPAPEPLPPPTAAPAPEISDLKSEIPAPVANDTAPTSTTLPASTPPIANRKSQIANQSLSSALAARQSHRDSATRLLTTAPHLPEPLRTEIFNAVAARLTQDASPSTVTIDPSATIQGAFVPGDGQTAVLRAPITITNARGATYRTQVAALLTPAATQGSAGWTITYLELQ